MVQIRADDEQLVWLPNHHLPLPLMMLTTIINEVAMMAWIRWHSKIDWYDVTNGSDTNFEITTESKESKPRAKWSQRQYPLSRYSLQQSRRQCIYHYLKKRVRKQDKTWDPNLKNPVKFRYTNWDLNQLIRHEARLATVFSLNKTFGENKRQENPI